ncbi:N-acetyltransferase family protein [Sunxiuqinia elliptica]
MENRCSIRIAKLEDAPEILEIYKPFITDTAVTFEEEVPTVEELKKRIKAILLQDPFLVCEYKRQVVGYAYASSYRSRAAYRWNRETSVYIHPQFRRKNIARHLYNTLIGIAKMQGYVQLYGVITLPNPGSVALHEAFGFKQLTVYHKVGFKLEQWHDVGWWMLTLEDNLLKKPADPIPFSSIRKKDQIALLLDESWFELEI